MNADEVFGMLCDDGVCMVASWGFLKMALSSQGRYDASDPGAKGFILRTPWCTQSRGATLSPKTQKNSNTKSQAPNPTP